MEDLEAFSVWKVLLGIAGLVLLYYGGTRGVLVLTERFAGHWYRRAAVSLSVAVLFAPSVAGVGHGAVMPVPAWMSGVQFATENLWVGVVKFGLAPILATWALLFAAASLYSLMSQNNKKKVDANGKDL